MASMTFDITARDSASSEFLAFATQVERLEKKLKDLDRMEVEPKVRLDTKPAQREVTRFATELKTKIQRAIRDVPPIDIDTVRAQARIASLKQRIDALRSASLRIDVDTGTAATDVGEIRRDLERLRDTRVKLDVQTGTARAEVTAISDRLRALRDTNVKLDVQTGTSEARVASLEAKLLRIKALSPLKIQVEVDDRASADLATILAGARALSAERPEVQVRADTAGAAAQMAALLAQLRALGASATTVQVRLDSPTFLGQLARIQTELRTLAGGNIEITADTRRMMQELAAARIELTRLQSLNPTVVVQADTAVARARVLQLERELAQIAGRQYTAKVDVDKTGLSRVTQAGKVLIALGAAGQVAAAGVGASVPAVASLVASMVSLVGLAPVAVGGLAALVAVTSTVKLGLVGLDEAFKNLDDPAKFAEALKELSPAGREFAKSVRDIKPAWDALQLGVQQKLLAGFGAETKNLAGALLPSLKSGLGGIASELNLTGKQLVAFATSGKAVSDIDVIFRNTTQALKEARPAATNVAAALLDIGAVGSGVLPELAAGATNVTGRFREFIAEASQSGQLEQWIRGGIDTLQTLGSIAGNVGGVLGSIWTASKASGADFLTTVDRVTERLDELLSSVKGQNALISFFQESRATVDALLPGLQTAGGAVLDFVSAFSDTGGLRAAGAAISDIAERVAPLGAALGKLGGDALGGLAAGASAAASALSPLVSVVGGVLGAMGPLPGLVLASVLAYKGLSTAAAAFAPIAARAAAASAAISASFGAAFVPGSAAAAGALGRASTALTAFGRMLPGIGIALIAFGAAAQAVETDFDGLTQKVASGAVTLGQAMSQAAEESTSGWLGFINWLEGDAETAATGAMDHMRESVEQYRASLSPMAQLQMDVATSQAELNDAVVKYTANSPQARDAAARLAAAQAALGAAQGDAAKLAQSHTDALKAQADQMSGQINTALAYEQAVQRTAEAQKAATDALKAGGAGSAEYKASVLDLALAMNSQAEAARKTAEALGGTEAGVQAYNTEILKAADLSTQAGRDAFGKLASGLDNAGLAALSATAQMSGLKTEVLTLPDNRKVTVVVAADQAQLDTAKKTAEDFVAKTYIGTVQIVGDPKQLGDVFKAQVALIDGTRATVTLDGNGAPLDIKVGESKYKIDSTTGTLMIDGNVAPGDEDLSGFKLKVDSTTGVMSLDMDPASADSKLQVQIAKADGSVGTITLDGNPTLVNGKTTSAVSFADGSVGTITLDGNPANAEGKVTGVVRYADGSTGTVTLNARDLASPVVDNLKKPTSSTHTINVIERHVVIKTTGTQYAPGIQEGLGAGGGLVGYSGGGLVPPDRMPSQRERPRRFAKGGVIAGYAPGVDDVPAILSRGEAVLVPELVRAIGPQNILAANFAASGRPPTFWQGGGGPARFAAGGMVRAEDGSLVPAGYYDRISPQLRAKQDGRGLAAGEVSSAVWSSLITKGWQPAGGRLYYPGTAPAPVAPPRAPVRASTSAPTSLSTGATAPGRVDVAAQIRSALDQFRTTLAGRSSAQLNDGRIVAGLTAVQREIGRSGSWPAVIGELQALRGEVRSLRSSRSGAADAQLSRRNADLGAW